MPSQPAVETTVATVAGLPGAAPAPGPVPRPAPSDPAQDPAPAPAATVRRRPGRRRDHGKDEVILQATRELLTERGYDAMTMDAVAERAGAGKATVYRRWPSKVALTVDSLLCSKQVSIDEVPDTGSLREDLLSVATLAMRLKNDDLMSGVVTAIREEPEVAAVFHEQFVAGRVGLMRSLLERARERGEVVPGADLDMIAAVGPAMIHYRKVVSHLPMDLAFAERMVDSVVLPLVTGRTTVAPDPAEVAGV